MVQLRRALPLATSLALVGLLGALASWGYLTTGRRIDQAQRADRLRLEHVLSGLTQQYLQFALQGVSEAAAGVTWHGTQDDQADQAALRRIVRGSHNGLVAAALESPSTKTLTSYAPGGTPSPTAAGLAPLRSALLQGRPGLSDVLQQGSAHLVAFGVPWERGGRTAGSLLAYADLATWPLTGYNAHLDIGRDAATYVLDTAGVVVASSAPDAIGRRAALADEVLGLPAAVRTYGDDRSATVLAYAPTGFGWTVLSAQDEAAFSGGLGAASRHDAALVLGLMAVVAGLLVWFNASRLRALQRLADERLLDPLTGLALRKLLSRRLDAVFARQRRRGTPVAVVVGDLDGFKRVNDTLGHDAGDRLLVEVAKRLLEETRDEDLVARLGGDEFAVVVEGAGEQQLVELVGRLGAAVERPAWVGSREVVPRISLGAALVRDPLRADEALAAADRAMYRVKAGEGGGIVVLELEGEHVLVPEIPRQPGGRTRVVAP